MNVLTSMTSNPPPYAPESKGMYPSVPPEPYQQPQQQPAGYYPHQPTPAGSPGYYPPAQQGQPQQFVVSSGPPTVVVAPQRPVQSFVCHIVYSCIVAWCCGCLCGLIAFIFARKLIQESLADAMVTRNSSACMKAPREEM